jgi:hypothetical protein
MFDRRSSVLWLALALIGALGLGCEESAPVDVAAGEFVIEIDGSVVDTLRGPAQYRMRDGRIAGLELGRPDGPGLSIELDPRPLSASTYAIVDGPLFEAGSAEAPAGAMAFLTTSDAEFTATRGSLTVERVHEQTVAATFSFEMRGRMRRGGGDAGVRVEGRLRAPPTRN